MPKIIENVRTLLIEEAKNQIIENDYENVTVRSIAKGCGLGLGTFYNYFKSKDMLIATFLLEDWQKRMAEVTYKSANESDPMVVVRALYDAVNDFVEAHHSIFVAPTAIKSFNMTGAGYHKFVRNQVAGPIYNACVLSGLENPEFLSLFVSEALITWTVANKDFDDISTVISKLFVK